MRVNIFSRYSLLGDYKQKRELIVEQDTYISPDQLFKGNVAERY
jgi:hypothetical protein